MHVLHLPPRHIGRVTAFAAALALAFVLLLALFTSDISGGGSPGSSASETVSSAGVTSVTSALASNQLATAGPASPPAWVRDPLAPATLTP